MRISTMLLGVSGLMLCLAACATCVSNPQLLSLQTIGLIGVCALGGLLTIRVPGLYPLPSSLPLVGAMVITAGAPAAVMAGFAAGLATALSPAQDGALPGTELPSRFHMGWTMSGALALAAGVAASGSSRLTLLALLPAVPPAAVPEEVLLTSLVLLSLLFLCWLVSSAMRRQGRLLKAAQARASTGIALVESIALAIEAKDRTSERHLRRMRIYSVELGRRLGMTTADLEALEYAALLHDIGKLVVPESILSKPCGLSSEEFQLMSTHARVGAEILETTSLPDPVASIVRHHHERYDGSGYPDGLVGMEIPLGARILAAVDTFEALTSERPYRPGRPVHQVVSFLQRQAGTLFDPRVVGALMAHHHEFEQKVVAEEKTRAAGRRRPIHAGQAETRKVTPPFQAVLDRIASSHMEIYSLHEITQVLGKSLNLDESFALIAGKIQRLIHFSSCAIYIFDPEKEILKPRFACGIGASRFFDLSIPLGQKISGWAALQGQAVSGAARSPRDETGGAITDLEELAGDPELALLTSSLAAPLMVDESLVGVITLYDGALKPYTTQEEHLLSQIARQVAGAIRTGLLFEQTQEHALSDSLTGLPNSRYMFIVFDQEAARARAQNTPLTLMVLDIDRFREINDDFGHHAGDRFLVGMAKAIRSQMRICDTCIRYSGDEFVALMPGLAGVEVDAVVERLNEAARDYCLEASPGRPVRLNLSIGYATMPVDGEDFETLIAVADGRMKEQKERHRTYEEGRFPIVPFGRRPA